MDEVQMQQIVFTSFSENSNLKMRFWKVKVEI